MQEQERFLRKISMEDLYEDQPWAILQAFQECFPEEKTSNEIPAKYKTLTFWDTSSSM